MFIYFPSLGLFSLKMKYDESDNIVIRATRVVTDKVTDIFSKYWLTVSVSKVECSAFGEFLYT